MTTKTAQHTPGPWEMSKGPPAGVPGRSLTSSPGWTVYAPDKLNPDGHLVVACYTYSEANARLIAAAPDLLAACKLLLRDPTDYGAQQDIRAVIAAAQEPTT